MNLKQHATIAAAVLVIATPVAISAQSSADAPGCWVRGDRADLELRASPFDSATVTLEPGVVKVCYSRPRKLGRPVMGRLVPYGEPWRLGADEATAIRVPVRATIAGVPLEPGWYSLYAVPGEREWRIFVNSNIQRWGVPIDDEVRRADVGSGTVPRAESPEVSEMLTFRLERTGPSSTDLVVTWDRTLVRIPVVLR